MIELTPFEQRLRAIADFDFASRGLPTDEEVREMSDRLIALLDLPTWKKEKRIFTNKGYEISGNTLYHNNFSLKLDELEKLPKKND